MHLGLGHSSASKEAQQSDSRESRRLFRENVRTDWNYPPLPAHIRPQDHVKSQADSPKVTATTAGGFKMHEGTPHNLLDQIIPDVVGWSERQYGSSGSEPEDGMPGRSMMDQAQDSGYMFEGPDSVGDEISNRALVRKRKRQKLLAEEMQWNDGLKHFISRRDIWTGARADSQLAEYSGASMRKGGVSSIAEAYNASVSSSPRSSTSGHTDASMASRPSTATTSPDPAAAATAAAVTMSGESKAQFPALPDMLIPTMSRLLTNHPVRKKIGPSMYAEIYNKIILQSRTPAVPINLMNLTRALVQGWKSDGEWPPKISAPEPSVARKKTTSGLKQGVKAVTRVLKITASTSENTADKKPD